MLSAGKVNGWLWGPHAATAVSIAALTAAIDQAHKWWMIHVFNIGTKGKVEVTPFLDLVFVINTGISYSLFDQSSQAGQNMLAAFAFIASAALWVWLNRPGSTRLLAQSLALIIGGAIGNGIDRLWLGGVADFFSLHAWGFYWYVFNIADVAIVAGVALLLYDSWAASRNAAQKSG